MPINAKAYWLRLVRLLVVGTWPLWAGQACSIEIATDTYTPLQITVQDSTGKPLPGFRLSALGAGVKGRGLTGPIITDQLVLTTDLSGRAEGRLHWHDNIERYFFSWSANGKYPTYVFFYPCNPPLTAGCELNYDRRLVGSTTNLAFRAKL